MNTTKQKQCTNIGTVIFDEFLHESNEQAAMRTPALKQSRLPPKGSASLHTNWVTFRGQSFNQGCYED